MSFYKIISPYAFLGNALLLLLLVPSTVLAFTVNTISYKITDQSASTPAIHELSFTTTSAIAAGETLQLMYPAGFSLSGITTSDINILSGGTVLSPVNWSMSVAGQTISVTFTNTIPAGTDIVIFIGDASLVTNPSTPGSYPISVITDAAEPKQAVIVPILESSVVGVHAYIQEPIEPAGATNNGSRVPDCIDCAFDDLGATGTFFVLEGYSTPNGTVDVYVDGQYITTVPTDSFGAFTVTLNNIPPGEHIIGLDGSDSNTVDAPDSDTLLSFGDGGFSYYGTVVLPPTIYLVQPVHDQQSDDVVSLYGFAPPGSLVDIYIDDVFVGTVPANNQGEYRYERLASDYTVGNYEVYSVVKYLGETIQGFTKEFSVISSAAQTVSTEESPSITTEPIKYLRIQVVTLTASDSDSLIPSIWMFSGVILLGLLFWWWWLLLLLLRNRNYIIAYENKS